MITGNVEVLQNIIDFSHLGIQFSEKPVVFGGAAMEYYGLRKRGNDFDGIITNDDYQKLAKKYPGNKKDLWGDLGLMIGQYELFRSVYRFGYDFFSEGAYEYDKFKVISFEKLFFMKVMAYRYQPEVMKLTKDFELMLQYYNDNLRDKEYVRNAEKHLEDYLSVPNGIILNDNYPHGR